MDRLRFAPSPTGYLHVGGARTALLNWLYCKHYGGQFLLRIEDTDKARSTEESTRAIFEGMRWLGLLWDGEVVYQGANLERHQRDANLLLENGHAYRCFCTPAELDERRKAAEARGEAFKYDRRCDRLSSEVVARRMANSDPFTIRFRVPAGETSWNDMVHEVITFPNGDIEDFVILRSDGTPIYNLAVVSDDIAMAITIVMRGDDHIANTPKQIMLYEALGADLPRFAHVPNILGTDGKKLSKRRGAKAVGDWQHDGILPRTMVNFLALLGWSPGGDREIMTEAEMIELFSVDGLQKKAAVFDPQKLEWMNGQYLSMTSAEELAPIITPMLVDGGLTTRDELERRRAWYHSLLDLLKVRARTTHDIVRQAAAYFPHRVDYDPEAVAKQWKDAEGAQKLLSSVRQKLAALPDWDASSMEAQLRTLAEQNGVSAGKLFQPLRVALTGLTASPGIFDVLVMLGRELSLDRLDKALDWLRAREGITNR